MKYSLSHPGGGVGTGTGRIKVGDGTTAYTSLPYFLNPDNFVSDISTATVTFTATSETNNTTLLNRIVTGAALNTIVASIKNLLSNLNNNLTANNTPFRFGYDSTTQKYGYILNQGGADTVIPFKEETIHTKTYTASSRSAALDMGETHNYRYVNTSSLNKISYAAVGNKGWSGSYAYNNPWTVNVTNGYYYCVAAGGFDSTNSDNSLQVTNGTVLGFYKVGGNDGNAGVNVGLIKANANQITIRFGSQFPRWGYVSLIRVAI